MELKYFSLSEFDCKSLKGSGINMDADFLQRLDKARGYSDSKFVITSGYRTAEHNAAIGSKSDNHPSGRAADIAATTSKERYDIISALLKAGFNRIGINFARKFIHVDSNGTDYGGTKSPNVIWHY